MGAAAVLMVFVLAACTPHAPAVTDTAAATTPAPLAYLESTLRPWGPGALAITDAASSRFAVYDSALVALVLLRSGKRDEAGRVLVGLAAVQTADGALPFSFTAPGPAATRYVRCGAVAWVGYAAAEYLDAEAGGRDREVALGIARKAAAYLLARRVRAANAPRDGLIRGGEGNLRYAVTASAIREIVEPADLAWVSVEHNVDAYFFLRALARATGEDAYAEAADDLGQALSARAWRADAGQLARGLDADGVDLLVALDCASWGSVFLRAIGDPARATISLATADRRFLSRDPRTGARGHLPYATGPLFEDAQLQQHYTRELPADTWDRLSAVWPEGSAGVALAALRAGEPERARSILDALEPLRLRAGALPTFTVDVPFTFDTQASIAGTAWVELVRYELARGPDHPTLWVP